MITDDQIIKSIPNALQTIDIPGLGTKKQGKVRDIYEKEGKLILVTTDRQSAFDVVLDTIPYRGAVLNQLSSFWFTECKDIVPNYVESIPDPNVTIGKKCEGTNIEMIVRGYITGVTKTSIWYSYQQGERNIYGMNFPEGLKKNQKLPEPVITPTTHGGGATGHDERLTREQILEQKIVPNEIYLQMEKAALELFERGTQICEKAGIILVDTKYEFGLLDGKLVQIDEMHTPDSSRFWVKETYGEKFAVGEEPESFDKEILRRWYADQGYTGDGTPPKMSDELKIKMSHRYIEAYEKITGKTFEAFEYPIEERIKTNLKKAGII